MNAPTWTLSIHGVPHLRDAAQHSTPLSNKDAALLAMVALDGPLRSVRAATLVWPATSESAAMNNLRQRLFRLRKATGARLLEVSDSARLADDLRLLPAPELTALDAEAPAWDAQLLQGIEGDGAAEFSAWLLAQRRVWSERRREVLASITSSHQKSGELVRALAYARRLLAIDPLSEHVHRCVMQLHYLRGDTAAAVVAFKACERVLKDELGLKPSAETMALLATVERGHAPAAPPRAPVPARLLRPPRTVGRDRQLAQIAQAHADGRIVVLVGEAGMGKTRLLQDFVASLDTPTLMVQARPGDTAAPYAALARLLRALAEAMPNTLDAPLRCELSPLVPEWAEGAAAADGSGQPATLLRAAHTLLRNANAERRLTLVLDDLHFADRATVEMLVALLDHDAVDGNGGTDGLRWLFAHRPSDAAGEDFALLRSLSDAPHSRWIYLSALTAVDLALLIDSLELPGLPSSSLSSELAPLLERHTGGNPLYVLETLRAMKSSASHTGGLARLALPRPEGIGHMLDRRLQRLSKPALALARVAAIAMPDFSIELAEVALGTPAMALADAWHELEAADVLRGAAFAHDLVHDAMLRITPQALMRHAQRQVALFMQQHGGEPARIAVHWEQADEPLAAADAWLAAAQRAQVALRMQEELALLQRALALLVAQNEQPRAFQVTLRIGTLQLTLGNIDAARRAARRLLDSAQAEGQRLQALRAMMDVHAVAMEHESSMALAEQIVAAAQASGDEQAELQGWRGLAAAHAYQGRYEQALQVHQSRATWLAQQPAREDLLEWNIDHAYMLDRTGQGDVALTTYADVAQRAIGHGFARIAQEAVSNQAMTAFRLGLTAQARALSAHAEQLANDATAGRKVNAIDQAVRGAIERDLGCLGEAARRLEHAVELAQAEGAHAWLPSTHDALALTYARAGQHHRALRLLDEPFDADSLQALIGRRLHRVMCERLNPARGSRSIGPLREMLASGLPERGRLLVLLELLAEQGVEEVPANVADDAVELARRTGGPGVLLHARLRRIESGLLRDGPSQAAAEEAVVAAAELEARDAFNLYRPQALLICAQAVRAHDAAAAARLLQQAVQWIEAATEHVPEPFRDSFLQRNSVNVQVLAAARR